MVKRIFFFILTLVFTSCATKKDIYYFQNIDSKTISNKFDYLSIQPGDILDIQIKALNPESVAIFQPQPVNNQNQSDGGNNSQLLRGYLVGNEGYINLPILGKIITTGLNTQTLSDDIQKKLELYFKSPNVKIKHLNFKVSVLGEVNRPGTYTTFEERLSIPQLLGMAGDLSITADRQNISLIRDDNGTKTSHFIDITKSDFLNSPFYFLKQNDILYVRPNTARVKSAGLVSSIGSLTGLISFAISLILISGR